MKIFLCKFCIFMFSVFALPSCIQARDNPIGGTWAFDCEESRVIKFINSNEAILAVSENQIYIKVKFVTDALGSHKIFFVDTAELGMGGANIDWGAVSLVNEIGNFKKISDTEVSFQWLGFYSKESRKRFLADAIMLQSSTETDQGRLVQCEK